MIKKLGPIRYFTIDEVDGLSAWLKGCDNHAHGFEWGWRDYHRGDDMPIIDIRIGKLWVLFLEVWKNGFELHLFGFWWIK